MEIWVWIVTALVAVLLVGGWAFSQWRDWRRRKEEESESERAIFNIIEDAISLLRDRLQSEMRLLDREKVKQVALHIYRNHVRGTPLAIWVSEDMFVTLFLDRWDQLAGLEATAMKVLPA